MRILYSVAAFVLILSSIAWLGQSLPYSDSSRNYAGRKYAANLNEADEFRFTLHQGESIVVIIRRPIQGMCYSATYYVEEDWKAANGVVIGSDFEALHRERLDMMRRELKLTPRFEAEFGDAGVATLIRHRERPC